MKMDRKFTQINAESEDGDTVLSFSYSMFKLNEFMRSVQEALRNSGLDSLRKSLNNRGGIPGNLSQWYIQGVDCELLKPGTKGWKKGKIKINISLEFSPDEPEPEELPVHHQANNSQPESPLDDIRRTMNQNT
jgi:hypothetical protein